MEIKGRITEKHDTDQITDNFSKRSFVLEHGDQKYLENIIFELHNEKCSLLDSFQRGQEVTVHFNLKGRKWTSPQGVDKYFNTLQAWKIEKL